MLYLRVKINNLENFSVWRQGLTLVNKIMSYLTSSQLSQLFTPHLTHWGRVTHICVSKLTTIGSDNGLSPGRRQAIIWTNAGILLIQTLETNFSEILREIHTFSFKKMHLKMSSGKCRPSCLGLNALTDTESTGHPSYHPHVSLSAYWLWLDKQDDDLQKKKRKKRNSL